MRPRFAASSATQPASAKGKLALARVLLAEGDREGCGPAGARRVAIGRIVGARRRAEALEIFRDLLTREDHRARMDKRIGAKDLAGARRAAQHLGGDELAIVKACAAVRGKADKAQDALDDVATEARSDLGYTLCRIQWMLAQNKIDDAARLMLAAAPETMALQDTDEWWRERRTLARKLLDQGKFQTAYDVIRPAAPPANEYYRADYHFMCGWIALALSQRSRDRGGAFRTYRRRPVQSDRAGAGELLARTRRRSPRREGRRCAQAIKRPRAIPTAYYGQLARAKLGRRPDRAARALARSCSERRAPATDERVRAADMLYEIGERDVVRYFVADLAEQSPDVAMLEALGELTGRRNDARAMLQVGKPALGRGLALDHYAFPDDRDSPAQPDRSRDRTQHHLFGGAHRERVRPARQVRGQCGRPDAGDAGSGTRYRQALRVSYDWDRMVSDPVYNTQMGAGELSALLSEYKGSHIMTFAGYNAGRGRVRDWIKAYGDPRDPKVDPVDWVERIPVFRNAKLRPARDGEFGGLPRPFRERAGAGGEDRRARRDAGDECGAAAGRRGAG